MLLELLIEMTSASPSPWTIRLCSTTVKVSWQSAQVPQQPRVITSSAPAPASWKWLWSMLVRFESKGLLPVRRIMRVGLGPELAVVHAVAVAAAGDHHLGVAEAPGS